ncbi:long-chain-fatty-acid--CoA ligase [Segnochrobactraceae bacterium EtOH-i3]
MPVEEMRHQSGGADVRVRHLVPTGRTLEQNLLDAAARWPDKAGLVFYDTAIPYAEMADTARRIAGFLATDLGVKPGDRVMIQLQSTPQFGLAYYGILLAGAVVVPVNPMNRLAELSHVAEDSGARVLFAVDADLDQIRTLKAAGSLDHAVIVTYSDYLRAPTTLTVPDFIAAPAVAFSDPGLTAWRDVLAADRPAPAIRPAADDLAVLPYTSGSSGRPKGCRHTHATTDHALRCVTEWFGHRHEDVYLTVAPLFHVTGMQTALNAPILMGGTAILLPRWDRDAAAEIIARYHVTIWPAIPTMAVDLLAKPGIETWDLSSIRVMFGGGVAMPEAVAARLTELCGISFLEGYGMTETMAPTTANPPEAPRRQCGGLPVYDTTLRIADPETLVEMPTGEVGEVLISGPQVFLGYWNRPEDDASAFVEIDGVRFLRSGDLGYIDDAGYLFLVDRVKRMINVAGYKVWPAEVETMLYGHPAIREVCVIGTPDVRSGEAVKAIIVLRDDAEPVTGREITDWARTVMSAYKIPRIIEFAETLPRSGTGKIQWAALQARERDARPAS